MSWLPFWRRAAPVAPVVDALAGGTPALPLFEGFRLDVLAGLPATTRAAQLFERAHGLSPAEAWTLYQRGAWPPPKVR